MKTSIRSLLSAIRFTEAYSGGLDQLRRAVFPLRGVLACVLLLTAAIPAMADCPGNPDFTKKTLSQLLVCLDDDAFFNRDSASKALANLKLTKADWTTVVDVMINTNSREQRRRIERLVERSLIGQNNAPNAVAAIELVKVKIDWNDGGVGAKGTFSFGEFRGKGALQNPVFTGLVREWLLYRNRIQVGNVAQALKQIDEMKRFINGLTPNEFASLNLVDSANQKVTKDVVLSAIRDAKNLTKRSELDLRNWGDFPVPDPQSPVRVGAAGPVNLGKTVAMNVQAIVTPGTLDYSWSGQDLAYAPAPTGFVSYGPRFDLQVNESLQVSGPVSFSIEYGDTSGNAYGITDPSKLAIVRISNGQYQLLSGFNDLGQHTITAVYQADTSPNFDQFGEFMLVAPLYPSAGGIRFAQAGEQSVIVYSAGNP